MSAISACCCSRKEVHRALQACNRSKDVVAGRQLYSLIVKQGLDQDGLASTLGDYLIRLFGSCALLQEARYVFAALPRRTVYSWHGLISAYTKHGDGHSALKLYRHMLQAGVTPDKYVFTCCLNACHLIDDISEGVILHLCVVKVGVESDEAIKSALINMYANCGFIDKAFHVFDTLLSCDIVVWDTLMFGCAKQGHGFLCLNLFGRMLQHGLEPSKVTFICAFKACSHEGNIDCGFVLHAYLAEVGLQLDLKVGNTLIDLYAKCGNTDDSNAVFGALLTRDVVSWCALISGYSEYGDSRLAIETFKSMQAEGVKPDTVTFLWVLKACGSLEFLLVGRLVYNQILQSEVLLDTCIVNTLIDMYLKCGSFQEADFLYNQLANPTAVSCAAMIEGYVQHGRDFQALEIFEYMQQQGLKPTPAIFLSTLKACRSIEALICGRQVHDEIIKEMLESDIQIGNTLIDFYAKCQCVREACLVFQKMTNQNFVSWGAVITGCVENGCNLTALDLYKEMAKRGTFPDKVTFLACLRACASPESVEEGNDIYKKIVMSGLESDKAIASSLVNMYSQCGCIVEARYIFDKCSCKDIAMWGCMIAGYTKYGSHSQVKKCLQDMQFQGIKPNDELTTSVLSLHYHSSASDICHAYCEYMTGRGSRDISIEHYSCIANILGHVGHLDGAMGLLHTMPISPTDISWTGLLTVCGTFGDHGYGYVCFDEARIAQTEVAARSMP